MRTHNVCTEDISFTEEIIMFEQECVHRHNQLRKQHGVKPLRTNQELRNLGQKIAEQASAKGKHVQLDDDRYSYNTCHVISRKMNGASIADMWYSEITYYNFNKPRLDDINGRFVRMIWRTASQIGVGVSRDAADNVFVVVVYNKPCYESTDESNLKENVSKPI
uniref:Golgi-associated plant pathogenesis-related protein 1-like isoform X1 n=1 Tax=Ciona intestinalis TaxID=7719 RepID=UPI000EF4B5D8|nr:Golgi-associated plant pathogenesis-related protein 1-like isoform X1 [Ciona intestinalis]|eukprot:XP_026696307.1 Golgi-associated plant pathogenesis-related protein 1-like isoform X1 [Ciona intestinalis]